MQATRVLATGWIGWWRIREISFVSKDVTEKEGKRGWWFDLISQQLVFDRRDRYYIFKEINKGERGEKGSAQNSDDDDNGGALVFFRARSNLWPSFIHSFEPSWPSPMRKCLESHE